MSNEQWVVVALPPDLAEQAHALDDRARAAFGRAEDAPVGDRADIVRYERAQTDLEGLAVAARNAGAPAVTTIRPVRTAAARTPSALIDPGADLAGHAPPELHRWRHEQRVLVEVCWPFAPGTARAAPAAPPRGPAERRPEADDDDAGRARLRAQLEAAVTADRGAEVPALTPGGLSNRTLTEGLRAYAGVHARRRATALPVLYPDGSPGRPVPLGAIPLGASREPVGRVLRFSLLSIRHVALDPLVDGAWLRNTEISRPRPMGQTDELADQQSREQLAELTDQGPVTLEMYQTGFAPAVIAFYRAVLEHLALRPGALVVIPRYYRTGRDYAWGRPWRSL